MEGETITLQDIFVAKPPDEETSQGTKALRLLGALQCSGLKPHFLDKMATNGVVLPAAFFENEEEDQNGRAGLRGRQLRQDLPPMSRRLPLVVALFCLLAPAAALAGIHVRPIDTTGYPRVRVTVVTDLPSTKAPVAARGREAGRRRPPPSTSGARKSVVLAIDRSQSMRGQPLATAVGGRPRVRGQEARVRRDRRLDVCQPGDRADAVLDQHDRRGRGPALDRSRRARRGRRMYDAPRPERREPEAAEPAGQGHHRRHRRERDVEQRQPRRRDHGRPQGARLDLRRSASRADSSRPATLKKLAAGTGGQYYAAASPGFLHADLRRASRTSSRAPGRSST